MRYWIVATISFLLFSMVAGDTVFSWKDAKGIVHYGDSPPESVNAKQVILPKLTILKDYGKLYQPVLSQKEKVTEEKNTEPLYKKFSIVAPRNKQAIRANDGDITVLLSLKPKLLPQHRLSIFLDGKSIAEGDLQMVNLTNLNRGEHAIYAMIKNKKGKKIKKSKVIVFSVIRY